MSYIFSYIQYLVCGTLIICKKNATLVYMIGLPFFCFFCSIMLSGVSSLHLPPFLFCSPPCTAERRDVVHGAGHRGLEGAGRECSRSSCVPGPPMSIESRPSCSLHSQSSLQLLAQSVDVTLTFSGMIRGSVELGKSQWQ